MIEYNGEADCLFPAGKEYRWVDMRSFRYQSERIGAVNMNTVPYEVVVRPDVDRLTQRYVYYMDYSGFFFIDATDNINPFTQGDYAKVHFTFIPPGNQPFAGKDVHLIGALTGNQVGDSSRMVFDTNKGVYEKTMFLKQGYYTYNYVTKDKGDNTAPADAALTDGNYWETSNDYTVLVYYRGFSDRADQLVGITTINSRTNRSGF
jgi:hypothetical protein